MRNVASLLLVLAALLMGVFTLILVLNGPPTFAAPPALAPLEPLPAAAFAAQPGQAAQQPDPPAVALDPTATLPAYIPADSLALYASTYDMLYSEAYRELESLIELRNDRYLSLVVQPVGRPSLAINFGGSRIQNGASTLKAPVLLYVIFRDPSIALTGWQDGVPRDAYRMIVGSHNSATGRVLLAASANGGSRTLDDFNVFLHTIIGLPESVGLTWWNYGVTSGLISDQVIGDFSYDEVGSNPYTLDSMVAFYEFLETPAWIEGAINQALATPGYPLDEDAYASPEIYRQAVQSAIAEARVLMSIPDPQFVTELERSLTRTQTANPDLQISLYGKNGTLRPDDWPAGRWQTIEGVVVTIAQDSESLRCAVAYSASQFSNDRVLDAALAYCVDLFRLDTGR